MSLVLSDLSVLSRAAHTASSPSSAPTSETQNAPASSLAANDPSADADNDVGGTQDPYAQIDALLSSLRDLTLGGASLKSAATPAQANAAYAAYAGD